MLVKLLKPFHFKVFFSNKYVHAMVLDKVTNVAVASVCSNNRAFEHHLGEKASKNNEKACDLLARMLARKIREREVSLTANKPSLPSILQCRWQLSFVHTSTFQAMKFMTPASA